MPCLINILTAQNAVHQLRPALIILCLISVILIGSTIAIFYKMKRKQKIRFLMLSCFCFATVITLTCTVLCIGKYQKLASSKKPVVMQGGSESTTTAPSTTDNTTESSIETEPSEEATDPSVDATDPSTDPTVPPVIEDPEPTFTPTATDTTKGENWGIKWEVIHNGSIVDGFNREQSITFSDGSKYSTLEGITTFRGDNYRSGATYGTANVEKETISKHWYFDIGTYNGWPGSGWTGQPLAVRWDEETKAIMNIFEEKKAKTDLVEVIHATLDGYIYFYDLDDGSYTRDPLWVGMNFKGAGAIDPRGYPLMYVGSGDYDNGKSPRFYIISLIDSAIRLGRLRFLPSDRR